jgi:hypothetical protein
MGIRKKNSNHDHTPKDPGWLEVLICVVLMTGFLGLFVLLFGNGCSARTMMGGY